MKISRIFSCLVPPGKHGDPDAPAPVLGTGVALHGKLFQMLADISAKADQECNIAIRFLMDEDGTQQNEARTDLIKLIQHPTLDAANRLGDGCAMSRTRSQGWVCSSLFSAELATTR